MRLFETMKEMCADCPFGHTKAQAHMRNSLRPGRFEEICQSVWQGGYFPCHKTTKFEDDDEVTNMLETKQCKGAVDFVARASENRRRTENRCPKLREL